MVPRKSRILKAFECSDDEECRDDGNDKKLILSGDESSENIKIQIENNSEPPRLKPEDPFATQASPEPKESDNFNTQECKLQRSL